MDHNPFSLDFGAEPNVYIPRFQEQEKIYSTFSDDSPSSHIYLLIGARGSGKTVLMTSLSHKLTDDGNWIHIDLNPEGDMMNSLAAQLYNKTMGKLPKLKLSASLKGINISIEEPKEYTDVQADIDTMLTELEKHHTRVLVTVDEIMNGKSVREFTGFFQHCLRERHPMFLLATGLYKNIRALQNHKSQTFLRRAPKIELGPLNLIRISSVYQDVLKLDAEGAEKLAVETSGYSYAFQILGYLLYDAGKSQADTRIISEYRAMLEESSYEKIWDELSGEERRVVSAIAASEDNPKVKDIREALSIDSNRFSTYQNSLQKSGVLLGDSAYGHLSFALPYFREFAMRH